MALLRIVFEGGSWDGRATEVDAQGSLAERWDKEEGLILVYRRTERTKPVEWAHDTRNGVRYTTEQATVYELAEEKPDLATRIARGEWSPPRREKAEKPPAKPSAKKPVEKRAARAEKGAKKQAKEQEPLF